MEIRARSLTCSYPAAGPVGLSVRRRPAVRDLTFEVAAGEVVSLAGKNGSGKSTTLRLLAGLLRPDSGQALLNGIPATSAEARRRLGYVAESDDFPRGLSVRRILEYAAVLAGYRGRRARREAAIAAEAVGLEEWFEVSGETCSHGIRRRISLAQALVGEPKALILDEVLTGLDPVARAQAIQAIRRAADGGAAVIASLHDGAALRALAGRLIVLADGVVAAGFPAETAAAGSGPGGAPDVGTDWLAALLDDSAPGRS